ncbi:MAG: NAD(P)/FAD-dependent oxidoreductase [Desulfobacteraceae bacterium]|jgi:glutathione reductase (NADPH)
MPEKYDVVVIGSGTAGQTAAYTLKKKGLKIALADHTDRPGGTCALAGCQAKKWFYEATELVARSQHLTGRGIRSAAVADWGGLLKEKNKFTSNIPENTVNGLYEEGIDYLKGLARFSDQRTIVVDGHNLTTDYILIASGAVPMPLPIEGAEHMITSEAFLELAELPKRIVFVGGGFISFEFAHFAARLGAGKTKCIILEANEHPLGQFDTEMVDLLTAISVQEKIDIFCDVNITAITKQSDEFTVKTASGQAFKADLVVHGAGRVANIASLELEKAGIEHTKQGITVTNEMVTTNPNVYAAGDCAATIQLARVADFEAQVAADNIIAHKQNKPQRRTIDYGAVPAVLFTYPQYAMVGMTEAALKQKGMAYQKSFSKNLSWPTYKRVGLKGAAFKILSSPKGNILGAHILSDYATGLINVFSLAINNQITVETLYRKSVMTPYPSRESDIIYMLSSLLE